MMTSWVMKIDIADNACMLDDDANVMEPMFYPPQNITIRKETYVQCENGFVVKEYYYYKNIIVNKYLYSSVTSGLAHFVDLQIYVQDLNILDLYILAAHLMENRVILTLEQGSQVTRSSAITRFLLKHHYV